MDEFKDQRAVFSSGYLFFDLIFNLLNKSNYDKIEASTDTGEDSKLVHRRKRLKVDALFSSLFSDASDRRV